MAVNVTPSSDGLGHRVEPCGSDFTRFLFSGDTRQLQAAEACDSLRVLEDESMLKIIELKSVQR